MPSDPEDELNNDELLTQITNSLSSSDETGPPVLVNDKFQTEYSVEKRKEILQKYKIPSNCTELIQRFGEILLEIPRDLT